MEIELIKELFFPAYMINYCEYGDKSGLTEEDIKLYEDWLKDNQYEYYTCDYDEDEDEDHNGEFFSKHPTFGLPCMTVTAYFEDISIKGQLRAMQKEYKDRDPINITFRRDKHTKEILMVYQANHSYDPTVKVCFTVNESHGSISKDYYREDTTPVNFEEYEETLKIFLNNYPADNYKIVKRINWTK